MAKLLVQIMTFAGRMIENGKWEVDFPAGLQEEQAMSLNLPIRDQALLRYLGKHQSINCVIDKDDDDQYMVAVACKVVRIRHMINTTSRTTESMAIVTPEDRTCESVLLYLLTPSKCDPRFMALVRGGAQPMPANADPLK